MGDKDISDVVLKYHFYLSFLHHHITGSKYANCIIVCWLYYKCLVFPNCYPTYIFLGTLLTIDGLTLGWLPRFGHLCSWPLQLRGWSIVSTRESEADLDRTGHSVFEWSFVPSENWLVY